MISDEFTQAFKSGLSIIWNFIKPIHLLFDKVIEGWQ